jgi:hypothetical protein
MCLSGPAGHCHGRSRPSIVRAGRPKHCRRCDALTQPARACGPPAAGTPPQHPDVGGACHRVAGGKFHVAPPARGLLPNRWGRLAAAKPLGPLAGSASTPGGSRCRGRTTSQLSASCAAPPGMRSAWTQLRRTQRHPPAATRPPGRRCWPRRRGRGRDPLTRGVARVGADADRHRVATKESKSSQ